MPKRDVVLTPAPNGDYWLSLPLAGAWTAIYQLHFKGEGSRRPEEIRELRIVPRRGHRATSFPFDAIRREITFRRFTDAVAAHGPSEVIRVSDSVTAQLEESGQAISRMGRPRLRLVDLAQLAVRYHNIEHDPRREPGESTLAILKARHYKHLPLSTIAKRIQKARERGLLTPVVRGQRGGDAKALAYTLTKRRTPK